MITSVKLKEGYEPQRNFQFLREVTRNKQVKNLYKRLEQGIEFKPGINILIGENGSGKSTILNIIKSSQLLSHSFISKMDYLPITTFENLKDLFDCFEIKGDYTRPVFNLYRMCEDKEKLASNDLGTVLEAQQFIGIGEESKGQNLLGDINTLFHIMFEKSEECFPLMHYLKKYEKNSFEGILGSDSLNCSDVIKTIWENHVEGDEFTILMDEPDSGLDVDNLKEIYGILSVRKEQTQLIASVHNVSLINKLSKIEGINIIEVSKGYLNKVRKFMED